MLQRLLVILAGALLAFLVFAVVDTLGLLDSPSPELLPAQIDQQAGITTVPASRDARPVSPLQASASDVVGLNRTRDSIQSVFEKRGVGFAFEDAGEIEGQPRVVGRSPDGRAAIQLIGSPDNLVSASVVVRTPDAAPSSVNDNVAYFLGLMQLGVPSWDGGTDWVHDNIATAMSAGEVEAIHANLRIQMQWLEDFNSLVLTVADHNWGVPALATLPIPEPAQAAAPPATPTQASTASANPPPKPSATEPATPRPTVTAGPPAGAVAGTGALDDIVAEADVSDVVNLILQALSEHRGLSLDDHTLIYDATGRTQQALNELYDTGLTGDAFRAAEDLLLTQENVLVEVENAATSGNIADLKTVAPRLVDLAERRLVFNRQLGNWLTPPAYSQDEMSVINIVRNDAALRAVISEVMAALAEGRPVDLEINDKVYQALSETSRGLDLIDEVGETGDVFNAAVSVLRHRRQFLIDVEKAVLSGNIDDLRAVAEDWVALSQEQLRFERQLEARDGSSLFDSPTPRPPAPADGINQTPIGESRISQVPIDGSSVDAVGGVGAAAGQAESDTWFYRVQAGDTLETIAFEYGTTVGYLARLNNISNPMALKPGRMLLVSMPSYLYEVKPGDTLSEIAYRHDLDPDILMRINQLRSPDLLYAGQKLLISASP